MVDHLLVLSVTLYLFSFFFNIISYFAGIKEPKKG